MLAKVVGAAVLGVDAQPVDVECDVTGGFPSFDTVGLAELTVREARVRVRSAIRHSNLPYTSASTLEYEDDGATFRSITNVAADSDI